MLVLTIRTDKPEAELGLFNGRTQIAYRSWTAHRELSNTILNTLRQLLEEQGRTVHDIEGVVCFQGPGSFTGLRIGLTVGNTLAYSLSIPIVATREDDWIAAGIEHLRSGDDEHIALPYYGAPVHITQQKK